MRGIDWPGVRLVVFDLDGTLYDQTCMRWRMLSELGLHCLGHPGDLRALRVIGEYRRCREALAEEGAESIGRLQLERPAARLGIRPREVAGIVTEWLEERPLKHLLRCRYVGVDRFFDRLHETGRIIGVLSDYPVRQKLQALELSADFIAAAPDPEIDRLKPHPAGLQLLMSHAGVTPAQCLVVGDREDRDGACARTAGVDYLIKVRSSNAPHHFRDYRQLLRGSIGVE